MPVVTSNRLGAYINAPYILAQAAIPMILCSSGTMGNNGAISGLTALPTTYAAAYIYLPANAISAGSSAGLYYFVGSSTTAGTVYNNTYTSGVPTIPASPTAFATTGPGAFTQSTSEITLQTITVPGGSMGANGALRVEHLVGYTNPGAGAKTTKLLFDSVTIRGYTDSGAIGIRRTSTLLRNRGSQSSQVNAGSSASTDYGTLNTIATPFTVDTSTDRLVRFTGQLAVATDFIVLEGYAIEVLPS